MASKSKFGTALTLFIALALIQGASADTEIVNIKSDSTWKAASYTTSTEWFKPDFDDSSWGSSEGRWPNSPCSKYCGKMNSCELTCVDWMWYNQSCPNCEVYFRKSINLPEEVMSASITMSADNYYWLYVNGNYVGSDTRKIGYTTVTTYDITRYMIPGKNVIAIKAQNDGEYEGVALTGEIKYKSYNTLISQLQSEIDGLESQLNTVSNDKNRLENQVDSLQAQVENLTISKDSLTSENSRLQIENLELKNAKTQLEASFNEVKSSLDTHKILNIVLILGLVIALIALAGSLYYIYTLMKGRRPRLSEPSKKMPTEAVQTAADRAPTSLSETETPRPTPVFQKKRETTLGGR
jgi:hypothetical protein